MRKPKKIFSKNLVSFVDEISSLEADLELLAKLAMGFGDDGDPTVIRDLGHSISTYLQKKAALDFYFFKRAVKRPVNDELFKSEMFRLNLQHGGKRK